MKTTICKGYGHSKSLNLPVDGQNDEEIDIENIGNIDLSDEN